MPRPGVPDDEDGADDDDAVGEARFTSAWREGGGVLSNKVEVAGRADEEDESRVEDEADAPMEDADDGTEEDRVDPAPDAGTDDVDALAVDATDSTMVEAVDAGTGAAVIVTNCVLTTVAVDTDTLTDTDALALPPVAGAEEAAEDAAEDEGAVKFADADDDADVAPEETRLELDEEEEVAVPEVVVPPPPPPPTAGDPTGTGVPTMAIGSPLGALGVAVGCTPAKFATGMVPLTVGEGSPSGYESSKMSSCAPLRKLYRFV